MKIFYLDKLDLFGLSSFIAGFQYLKCNQHFLFMALMIKYLVFTCSFVLQIPKFIFCGEELDIMT